MLDLGVGLILAGLMLLLVEAHMSTGGLIGALALLAAIGGIVVLLLGAGVAAAAVLIVALVAAALAVTGLVAWRRHIVGPLQQRRPRTGREALVGHVGVVRSIEGPGAQIFVDGSLWRAEADPGHEEEDLHDGDRVVVERVNGLTLRVRRAEEWELNP